MSVPQMPIESAFARSKSHMDTTIAGLIRTAETCSLGIGLLKELQRWCECTQSRIEGAIILLEQQGGD